MCAIWLFKKNVLMDMCVSCLMPSHECETLRFSDDLSMLFLKLFSPEETDDVRGQSCQAARSPSSG